MAPPVKIKDGRRVAAEHSAAVADGYLLPYLCPNTAVLGSGRGHRYTRQGGAGGCWLGGYLHYSGVHASTLWLSALH